MLLMLIRAGCLIASATRQHDDVTSLLLELGVFECGHEICTKVVGYDQCMPLRDIKTNIVLTQGTHPQRQVLAAAAAH